MTILDIFIICTTYSRITIIGVKIADLKNSRCNPLGKANDAKIVVITMKFFDVLLLGGNFLSFFTERFVSYFRNLSLVVHNAGDKTLYFHTPMTEIFSAIAFLDDTDSVSQNPFLFESLSGGFSRLKD